LGTLYSKSGGLLTTLEEAGATLRGKHSDTRINALPLANGHGRYYITTAIAPEQTPVSVEEWPLHVSDLD
jgi:hypothetical protein